MAAVKWELPDGAGIVVAVECALCGAAEPDAGVDCARCGRSFCAEPCFAVHLAAVDDPRDEQPSAVEAEPWHREEVAAAEARMDARGGAAAFKGTGLADLGEEVDVLIAQKRYLERMTKEVERICRMVRDGRGGSFQRKPGAGDVCARCGVRLPPKPMPCAVGDDVVYTCSFACGMAHARLGGGAAAAAWRPCSVCRGKIPGRDGVGVNAHGPCAKCGRTVWACASCDRERDHAMGLPMGQKFLRLHEAACVGRAEAKR